MVLRVVVKGERHAEVARCKVLLGLGARRGAGLFEAGRTKVKKIAK